MRHRVTVLVCTASCCLLLSCASVVPGWIRSEVYGKGSLCYGASFILQSVQIERSVDAQSLERELAALVPLELGRLGFTQAGEESNADYVIKVYGYEREYFQGYKGKRAAKVELEFFLAGNLQSFLSVHAWMGSEGNLLLTGTLKRLVMALVYKVSNKITGRKL